MAMFEMLPEVVRAEELLRVVTLPEFVYINQMLDPGLPVALCRHFLFLPSTEGPCPTPCKLVAAVAASVSVVGRSWRGVKGIHIARERGARPGMTTQVERVLVSLCFIFVLETILAISAFVLFLRLVSTKDILVLQVIKSRSLELTSMLLLFQTFWASSDSNRTHTHSGPSRRHFLAGQEYPETYARRLLVLCQTCHGE
jgi:hypothetical protein